MADNRNETERLLNAAMDHIAGTLEQPADPRAWDHLLIYAPPRAVFNRLVKCLNYDGADLDSLTIGEIRRAIA